MSDVGCSLSDPLTEKCGGKADYTTNWLITIIILAIIILVDIIKKEMEKKGG